MTATAAGDPMRDRETRQVEGISAAAGLIVLAWVALAVQSRLARSRGTTQALRVGE